MTVVEREPVTIEDARRVHFVVDAIIDAANLDVTEDSKGETQLGRFAMYHQHYLNQDVIHGRTKEFTRQFPLPANMSQFEIDFFGALNDKIRNLQKAITDDLWRALLNESKEDETELRGGVLSANPAAMKPFDRRMAVLTSEFKL